MPTPSSFSDNPYRAPEPSEHLPGRERGGDPFAVEFDFELADLVRFNDFHMRTSPTARRQMLIVWFGVPILMGLLLLLLASMRRRLDIDLPVFVPIVAVLVIYLVFYPYLYRRRIHRYAKRMYAEGRNSGVFGRRRVRIFGEGMSEEFALGFTMRRWPAIERIAVGDDFAAFYNSAISAILVPRRAFATQADFDAYVAKAQEFKDASERGVAPPTAGGDAMAPIDAQIVED